jgi:hypothetical protein
MYVPPVTLEGLLSGAAPVLSPKATVSIACRKDDSAHSLSWSHATYINITVNNITVVSNAFLVHKLQPKQQWAAVVLPWFVHRPSWRAIPAVGQALLCCAAAHVELLRP